MSDELFHIVFSGELLPDRQQADVAAALERLFKSDSETIARLFDGRSHIVKRSADTATAERYRISMERAGAIVELKPLMTPDENATPASSKLAA